MIFSCWASYIGPAMFVNLIFLSYIMNMLGKYHDIHFSYPYRSVFWKRGGYSYNLNEWKHLLDGIKCIAYALQWVSETFCVTFRYLIMQLENVDSNIPQNVSEIHTMMDNPFVWVSTHRNISSFDILKIGP